MNREKEEVALIRQDLQKMQYVRLSLESHMVDLKKWISPPHLEMLKSTLCT